MEQLMKNKEFKSKMASLSPGVKHWFINALVDLFEQESEYVIDVLEDCRYELGLTAETYVGEAEHLRAASRMLEERRDPNSRVTTWESLSTPSLQSLEDDDADQYSRAHRHERRLSRLITRQSSSDLPDSPTSESLTSVSLPSPSERTPRARAVAPIAQDVKALEEETQAILKTMTEADAHVQRERERQQERLERIRRQKKFLAEDRTEQAMKLLEKALEMDRILAQDKERQGKMLQDKLQGLKRRRNHIQATHTTPEDSATTLDDVESS